MTAGKVRFRVFFACVGNSGRSQMAEGFCRTLSTSEVECKSGGTKPSGRLQPEAVKVMAERGVDLSTHHSKPIDEAFASRCDLIVTMGCGDDACPAFIGKAVEDWELKDPKGAPLDELRKIRDDIEGRVRHLLSARGLLKVGP